MKWRLFPFHARSRSIPRIRIWPIENHYSLVIKHILSTTSKELTSCDYIYRIRTLLQRQAHPGILCGLRLQGRYIRIFLPSLHGDCRRTGKWVQGTRLGKNQVPNGHSFVLAFMLDCCRYLFLILCSRLALLISVKLEQPCFLQPTL